VEAAESENTLAYYDSESKMSVKVFIVKAAEMKKANECKNSIENDCFKKSTFSATPGVNSTKTFGSKFTEPHFIS
jgi:hypothetical protein